MKDIKNFLIIVGIFLIIVLIVFFNADNDFKKSLKNRSNLYISEISSNNEISDYIELYNDYDYDINLEGYYLSDELESNKKWKFPNIVIKSKNYLIVYADKQNICDLNTNECHSNFKINKDGEVITLLNNKGNIIDKVEVPYLSENLSYSYMNGVYKISLPTPLNENIDLSLNYYSKDIIINEVSSVNPEAIELKNLTDKEIDLSNYYVSDKNNDKYQLNNIKIKPHDYIVLYGKKNDYNENDILVDFRINNSNEIIYLYKDDKIIDSFIVGKTNSNISKGKNDNLQTVIYKEKSFGKDNSSTEYYGFCLQPNYSINGGYVSKGTKLELLSPDNGIIYYTLDGSEPGLNSLKYEKPIFINSNVVIKSISYNENYIESDVVSRTFFVDRIHDLPVISISTSGDNLFGKSGIFTMGENANSRYPYYGANFWEDKEVPISFEFYEKNSLGFNFNGGMKIFGAYSRGEAQKSVTIYLKKKYGLQEIIYPLFEDSVNIFSKFVLRSGGQDFGYLKLKDAFLQKVLDGQMDIDKQDYRFVVVYFNGIYYGIYNIREKMDSSYVKRHYGYEENEITFIEKNSDVKFGSIDEYNGLLNYVKTADMALDSTYEYLSSIIDLQELCNYWTVQTFFDQFDPMNIKFYKPNDGKWRWLLFDLDQTFFDWTYKTIKWNLPFEPYAHGNNYYLNTTLMKNLIKNPKFKNMYNETFLYHLKNTFNPERMSKILDDMVEEIKEEMPYHIKRWYKESLKTSTYTLDNINEWYQNIASFKKKLNVRYKNAISTIQKGLNISDEEFKKYF